MQQKHLDLFKLIKALSSKERTYFIKFKKFEDGNPNLIELFDLYVKYRSKDANYVEEKAIGLFNRKQYLSLKKELFSSICDVMCYYLRKSENRFIMFQGTQKIFFLVARNLINEAAKHAHNLRSRLYKESKQPVLIPLLYAIENHSHCETLNVNTFCETLQEHQKILQIIDNKKELHDSRTFYTVLEILNNKSAIISEENKIDLNKFILFYKRTYNDSYNFVFAPSHYYHLNSFIIDKNLSPKIKLKYSKTQLDLIKNNVELFYPDAILYSYNSVICNLIQLNKFEEAQDFLEKMETYNSGSQFESKIKYEFHFLLQLKIATKQKDYEKIKSIIENFILEKENFTFKFSKLYLAEIMHYKLFANIFTFDVTKNKKILVKYTTSHLKKSNPELFDIYRIIEILNLIELNDFDSVTYKIRNAKLSFKDSPEIASLLLLIDNVKNKLEMFNKNNNQIITDFTSLSKKHFGKENSHLIYQNFNLSEWALKKLN